MAWIHDFSMGSLAARFPDVNDLLQYPLLKYTVVLAVQQLRDR